MYKKEKEKFKKECGERGNKNRNKKKDRKSIYTYK